MPITVYHFCCERDMRGIRSQGITKGMIVREQLINPGALRPRWNNYYIEGWQWMTYDGCHSRQSWATRRKIWYDRTEYRFTVEIPEKDVGQIYDRDRLAAFIPGTEKLFDGWEGSENWIVYRGNISKYQLKKLEHWNKEKECWEVVA